MKKQSIAKIILINFFRTIGVMILLVGVGVLSYYLTMLYLRQNDKTERSTTYTHVIPVNAGTESSNLIYAYNETTRKVEGMVLELFDQDSKNMTYVTIPANTKITISQATYTELLAVNSSIPQVVTMGDLISYFSGDVAYEYGIKVLEGEIGSDIGYFTAMTSQKFQVYYEFATKKKNCFTPTDAYISTLKKCVGEPEMKELIEDMWDDMITDLTLSQKENYAADLSKVNWDYIHAYRISGKEDGDSFVINQKKAKKLINKIWESDAYAESQFDTSSQTEEAADEAQNIEILNGSAIDGLDAGRRSLGSQYRQLHRDEAGDHYHICAQA